MNWFIYTLCSVVSLGAAYTLFKKPSMQGLDRFASTFWTNIFIVIISLGTTFFFSINSFNSFNKQIFFIAIIWGVIFSLNMFFQMSALKKMNAGAMFPIASALSTLLVVSIGIFFLSESLSFFKLLGVILVVFFVYLFTKKDKKIFFDKQLILYFIGIVITSVLVKFLQKIAIGIAGGDVLSLMPIEHLFAAIFSAIFGYIFYKEGFSKKIKNKKEIVTGIQISIPLFLGGFFLISALTTGETSQVFSIHPAYAAMVAIFSSLFFKEKLGWKKLLLILGIVLGIILIKIG